MVGTRLKGAGKHGRAVLLSLTALIILGAVLVYDANTPACITTFLGSCSFIGPFSIESLIGVFIILFGIVPIIFMRK